MVHILDENKLSVLSDYLARAIRMNDEEATEILTSDSDKSFIASDTKELRAICAMVDDAIDQEKMLVLTQTEIT